MEVKEASGGEKNETCSGRVVPRVSSGLKPKAVSLPYEPSYTIDEACFAQAHDSGLVKGKAGQWHTGLGVKAPANALVLGQEGSLKNEWRRGAD